MKYLRYYISTVTLIAGFLLCLTGSNGPTLLFAGFSLLIIFGDILINEENSKIRVFEYNISKSSHVH